MLDKLKDLDLRYEDLESQLGDPGCMATQRSCVR